jgi:hypothetical protein
MARRAADSSSRLGVVAQEQEFPARRLPAPARLLPLPRWRAGDRMLNGKASLRRTRKRLGNRWPSLRRSPCLSRHFRVRIKRYQSFAAPFSGQPRAAFESERWSAVLDHTILTYVLFHYTEALNGARIVEGLEMFRKKAVPGEGGYATSWPGGGGAHGPPPRRERSSPGRHGDRLSNGFATLADCKTGALASALSCLSTDGSARSGQAIYFSMQ